jgi:hypothetical protein
LATVSTFALVIKRSAKARTSLARASVVIRRSCMNNACTWFLSKRHALIGGFI